MTLETALSPETPNTVRRKLEDIVLNDLLGPASGPNEEVDEGFLRDRYLVGLVAPQTRRGQLDLPQEEIALGGADSAEEGRPERVVAASTSMFPSSIGLTFSVSGDVRAIRVCAGWGQYRRGESTVLKTKEGNPKTVWLRAPISETSDSIELREGALGPWVVHKELPDVTVKGIVRKQDGDWLVSVFLVNGQVEPEKLPDTAWLFQPELSVEAAPGERRDCFVQRVTARYSDKGDPASVAEQRAMRMLYRKCVEFAVGHGVGVHVDRCEDCERAERVATSVVPSYEVAKTAPPDAGDFPLLEGLALDMKALAEMDAIALEAALAPLPRAYEAWIQEQAKRLDDPTERLEPFRDAATEALDNCRKALERIREGMALLRSNEHAAEAFRFMNRAMWLQRTRSITAEQRRRGEEADEHSIDVAKNRSWYVFQLAFILLNLPSLTDLHHPDRSRGPEATADLLWFPTGGGKTEAYLGLAAYTLGIRRLQGVVAGRSGEFGIAVLMRYTLRLLTLQQFQRATALVCACESIRREALGQGDGRWGNEPFRIGLWVGQKTTPNHTSQAGEAITQVRGRGPASNMGSPHQLTNCPWCGTQIDPGRNIKVDPYPAGSGRTLVYCGDTLGRCLFTEAKSKGEGIPILVVDEEIYRRLPALLIATVDKFASLPWEGKVQMLFGHVDARCPRHGFISSEVEDANSHQISAGREATRSIEHGPLRPPDLIIQDELHLISGPLGTLVGLYETAVDHLASWEVDGRVVRPKVVASTATIRQAKDQVHHLFLRSLAVFPPAGLDVEDNFFALRREPGEEYPGRRYIGICASGRRLKVALIRVYVALMSAAQEMQDKYGMMADPYMTLVGYFNSLRELGGMRRLVDDDIKSRLAHMDQRGMASRHRVAVEELTSRKTSTEIPEVLDRLETRCDPELRKQNEAARKAGRKATHHDPIDVLLATNMLSVGVDVKRLGAMVVAGQPKNTAEYIQATSRVGRTFPGLVITVYNWARPRDLSHYERFEHYHATFYQHVEALSVTPFASGAMKRGLSALLVALVRQAGRELNGNGRAAEVTREHEFTKAAVEAIERRAEYVGGKPRRDYVGRELSAKLDSWISQAHDRAGGRQLGYKSARDGVTVGLLKDPLGTGWDQFTCPRSLRNVEPAIRLILDERLIGDGAGREYEPMEGEDVEPGGDE
jgi:hypothetical protein